MAEQPGGHVQLARGTGVTVARAGAYRRQARS